MTSQGRSPASQLGAGPGRVTDTVEVTRIPVGGRVHWVEGEKMTFPIMTLRELSTFMLPACEDYFGKYIQNELL